MLYAHWAYVGYKVKYGKIKGPSSRVSMRAAVEDIKA